MKLLKTLAISVIIAVTAASCGNNVTANSNNTAPAAETFDSSTAGPAVNSSDWASIYSSVLNGQNELGIDFTDYNVGDETDVTKIRRYLGCSLYDLDGNGIPELFVSIGLWEGGFYHVFTADNNKGKYIGESKAGMVEKSTGILFHGADESGYTPDIAYEYKDDSLVEIPGYVQSIYATPEKNYPQVILGENTLRLDSDDIVYIDIYDSLEAAADNYIA